MTDPLKLYESEHTDIYHAIADGWLYVDWKGQPSGDEIKDGCTHLLDCIRHTGVTKILNDNRRAGGFWVGSAYWLANMWFPLVRAAGVTRFAWIQSPSDLSRFSAVETVRFGLAGVRLFDTADDARRWLAEDGTSAPGVSR